MLLAFFVAFTGFGMAQVTPTATPARPKTTPTANPFPRTPAPRAAKRVENDTGFPAEKSIAVDSKVFVKFCVSEGTVKINGWDRNEVRAMVEGGTLVGFRVTQKNGQGNPTSLNVLPYDSTKYRDYGTDQCLSGSAIELDVPHGASINVEGREFEVAVDSINSATIGNDSGDISLNGITQSINVKSYDGSVRVENSSGAIALNTTNGSVWAYNVEPSQVSDVFRVKTISGAISLQSIAYSLVDTSSTSGAISFAGNFLSGGQYKFNAQFGSILLRIPQKSSFAVSASYSTGNFQSELPINNMVRTPAGSVQRLNGVVGTGEASLNLLGGSIYIKRKD